MIKGTSASDEFTGNFVWVRVCVTYTQDKPDIINPLRLKMEHFVRIVMEKQDELVEGLDKSVFPESYVLESEQGATVFHIPLARELSEQEADEYADRLTAYMVSEGYEDFDIEISTDEEQNLDEETYDGDEFFEEYGVMWFNEDDEMDEAEYQGRKVKLGKPMRGDVKKFKVYVRDPKTKNIKKVNFGDPNMKIKQPNVDVLKDTTATTLSQNKSTLLEL